MKWFFTVLIIAGSFGYVYAGTRKETKKKVLWFLVTTLLVVILGILEETILP